MLITWSNYNTHWGHVRYGKTGGTSPEGHKTALTRLVCFYQIKILTWRKKPFFFYWLNKLLVAGSSQSTEGEDIRLKTMHYINNDSVRLFSARLIVCCLDNSYMKLSENSYLCSWVKLPAVWGDSVTGKLRNPCLRSMIKRGVWLVVLAEYSSSDLSVCEAHLKMTELNLQKDTFSLYVLYSTEIAVAATNYEAFGQVRHSCPSCIVFNKVLVVPPDLSWAASVMVLTRPSLPGPTLQWGQSLCMTGKRRGPSKSPQRFSAPLQRYGGGVVIHGY